MQRSGTSAGIMVRSFSQQTPVKVLFAAHGTRTDDTYLQGCAHIAKISGGDQKIRKSDDQMITATCGLCHHMARKVIQIRWPL
jgi:hypothetical protein